MHVDGGHQGCVRLVSRARGPPPASLSQAGTSGSPLASRWPAQRTALVDGYQPDGLYSPTRSVRAQSRLRSQASGAAVAQRSALGQGVASRYSQAAFRNPFGPSPIEHRHLLVTIEAQRPPEPRCPGMVRLGVSDHSCVIPDPDRFHHGCEWLRWQEQVPHSSLICPTQISVPIEMNGSWKMPTLVEITTGAIATPTRIHNAEITLREVSREPRRFHQGM